MQTSVYIPEQIAKRLEDYVGASDRGRNKIIVEAIEEYLSRREQHRDWSPQIQLWFSEPEVEEELDLHREDHGYGEFTFEE